MYGKYASFLLLFSQWLGVEYISSIIAEEADVSFSFYYLLLMTIAYLEWRTTNHAFLVLYEECALLRMTICMVDLWPEFMFFIQAFIFTCSQIQD